MHKQILAAGLVLIGSAGNAVAQLSNTAVLRNAAATLRSDGMNFTNASGGSYTVSLYGTFEHNTPNYVFTNDGTYNAVGSFSPFGVDRFTGSGTATIAGSAQPIFDNLAFANRTSEILAVTNSAGIRINRAIDWNGGGVITTPRTGSVVTTAVEFWTIAGYVNASAANQHVDGYVKKSGFPSTIGRTFNYPVGNGIDRRSITISAGADDVGIAITTAYLHGSPASVDPTSAPANLTALASGLLSVSPLGGWDLVAPTNADNLFVQVSIPDMSVAGGYGTAGDMRLVGYNTTTSQWELLGTTGASGNTAGSTLNGTIPANLADDITALGIGSVTAQPLPLQLLDFTASVNEPCSARLLWHTAAETGVRGFEVEWGTDGRGYRRVGEVAATGAAAYHFVFDGLAEGQNFFRLKMVDMDGSFAYSPSAVVRANCATTNAPVVGPNPVTGDLSIGPLRGATMIRVFAATGQLVYEANVSTASARIATGDWASGQYLVHIAPEGAEPTVQRVTKQ